LLQDSLAGSFVRLRDDKRKIFRSHIVRHGSFDAFESFFDPLCKFSKVRECANLTEASC
jgi:hypothetical protein